MLVETKREELEHKPRHARRRIWPGVVLLLLFSAALAAGLLALAHSAKAGAGTWTSRVSPSFTVAAGGRLVRAYVTAENRGPYTEGAYCEVWGYGKPGQHMATGWGWIDTAVQPGYSAKLTVRVYPERGHHAAEVTVLSVSCFGWSE